MMSDFAMWSLNDGILRSLFTVTFNNLRGHRIGCVGNDKVTSMFFLVLSDFSVRNGDSYIVLSLFTNENTARLVL